MEAFLNWFQIHLPFLVQHKYLFLFLAASIEGMNSIILAGFMAATGAVLFFPIFLLCLLGDMANGFAWYGVGYFAGAKPIDKWVRKDEKSRKIIETVEKYFHRYSGRAIILAKLTWSLTIATMIMAGSFKYNFRKFTWYNFLGGLGWVTITFTIGYGFGAGYRSLFSAVHIGYLVLFLATAIAAIYILRHLFRSRFFRSLSTMQKIQELGEKVREGINRIITDPEDRD
ncbi:MAG TPA: DedA family protein [Candidatus Paceibacterota bacterium]|nr:DedA family protein [Candidatus Paceibacterota bacterium]